MPPSILALKDRLNTPCLRDLHSPSQCLLYVKLISLTQGVSSWNTSVYTKIAVKVKGWVRCHQTLITSGGTHRQTHMDNTRFCSMADAQLLTRTSCIRIKPATVLYFSCPTQPMTLLLCWVPAILSSVHFSQFTSVYLASGCGGVLPG